MPCNRKRAMLPTAPNFFWKSVNKLNLCNFWRFVIWFGAKDLRFEAMICYFDLRFDLWDLNLSPKDWNFEQVIRFEICPWLMAAKIAGASGAYRLTHINSRDYGAIPCARPQFWSAHSLKFNLLIKFIRWKLLGRKATYLYHCVNPEALPLVLCYSFPIPEHRYLSWLQ